MNWMLKQAFGYRMPGMQFDTADDIFAGAVEDAQKLLAGGGTDDVVPDSKETTPDKTQDVDQKDQGKEQQPGTPDKSADEKSSDKKVEEDADKKEKEKIDGAAEARKWGEGWKSTAEKHETRLKEVEPILKLVEDEIGGEENLKFATEIFRAIANEDEFDAKNAVEFLSENLPGVADKLYEYLTKDAIERATSTSLQRTFGRNLSDGDVKAIKSFLAAGKPSDPDKLAAFFKSSDELPDELRLDPETGEERDSVVLDYIRNQNALLKETQAQLKSLEGRVTGADEERNQQAASDAIEKYVSENFAGIVNKISELGLDKAVEGETPEVASLRERYSGAIEGIALHLASKDAKFQAMYVEAIKATAKLAMSPNNRASKAKAQDFSRRITARVNEFAAEAAEIISPLLDSLSASRQKQVEKVQQAKDEPDVQGDVKVGDKKVDPTKDPFDSDDIQREIDDIMRSRRR